MAIHPLALVSPRATLGAGVSVGPFCVVEDDVVIGAGTQLAARVSIKNGVRMGAANMVEEGAVIGGLPQHLKRQENPGLVVIGDRNTIRENVTIHRPMAKEGVTSLGNDCLLMVGAHMAHDCHVANNVVLTNNVMLGGHVTVGERANIGGGAAVHQHCRIGRLAMIGGMARVTQDVPPFVMIDGDTALVVGLNRIGLRRAGLNLAQINELKEAYRLIYRSGLSFTERLTMLSENFPTGPVTEWEEFYRGGTRGFVRERRTPPGATIRPLIDEELEVGVESERKARRAG